MYFYAARQHTPESPLALALVVAISLTIACVISGICGVLTPLALRRIGADPATASSIFLTTASDIASMGIFLGLASLAL
jgi:magnesium transporter